MIALLKVFVYSLNNAIELLKLCILFSRLSVTTQPLDVVYNPLVLDHISEFFSHASMEGTQALHIERQLREVARVRYEALKNQTRAELIQTLDAMMEGSEVVIQITISLFMLQSSFTLSTTRFFLCSGVCLYIKIKGKYQNYCTKSEK